MKVLMINSVCGIKSTGRICTDLAMMLEEDGNECKIIYGRDYVPEELNKYSKKINTEKNVYIDALKARLLDNEGFNAKSTTKKIIKWIEEYNPDIIHLHNLHGYYINLEILFKYLKEINKPVIWTLHDCWSFTGHCAHFVTAKCDKWKTGCYKCPLKKSYPSSFILDKSKKNYIKKKDLITDLSNLTIVSPSIWLGNLCKESFLQKFNIMVINNGVNFNYFKPCYDSVLKKELCNEDDFLIIGFANKWLTKDNQNLINTLDKKLDKKIKILIIGDNEAKLDLNNERFIIKNYIKDPNELAKYYSISNVFVNLTNADTFPTVNIESIACGTPVITYDVGGSPEILDKETGIVIKENSIEELIDAIKEVYDNGKDFYYDKCIARAHSLYDKDENYKKYLDLYYSLYK